MPEKVRRVLLLLLAALLMLGAACGGNEEGSEGGGDAEATEDSEETSETPEDSADATEEGDDEEGDDEDAAAGGELSYTAVDFSFDGPTTLPEGEVKITLANEGEEPHELVILGLNEGKTLDDVMAAVEEGTKGPPPKWVDFLGGIRAVKPGKTRHGGAELEAGGNYVLACFIPSKENAGKPHALLGMLTPITVE